MSAGFVLMLHSHLPWVLHHGRWPHGSDWLCEAAVDTYLPLVEALRALDAEGVAAPVTIGVTPVLANQLAHPDFRTELAQFFAQRFEACDAAPASLARTGETSLVPIVGYWRARYGRLHALFEAIGGDLVRELRRLADAGRIELVSSAATHGFLPLLACDESIQLQLRLGAAEHRRLFGRAAEGCWLPECAYRPRGPWAPAPDAPGAGTVRTGLETHLADAGFRYAFIDAHLAAAGHAVSSYGDTQRPPDGPVTRTPYRPYRLTADDAPRDVAVFVRDPRASMQVWSRFEGYPGDAAYLEFHKMRWPGGLKLWRVTGPGVDLGGKAAYEPDVARGRAAGHADHFAHLLRAITNGAAPPDGAVVAPFDTELFGHWWFEGPDFVADLYRDLARQGGATPTTAGRALAAAARPERIALPEGSWGANGDFSMWWSDRTAWTWRRLWPLERRFWTVARAAIGREVARDVLAQAARELLLAQASDWQFIISTGAAADYAERRFSEHCADLERLLDGLAAPALSAETLTLARALHDRDDCFPDVATTLAGVLRGAPASA